VLSRYVGGPVIRGWRGCALNYLYALHQDAAENEAVLTADQDILKRHDPGPARQPRLVARIGSPRPAGHRRGERGGTSNQWPGDALSPPESTACALVNQVLGTGKRRILLCGDDTLALEVLLELAHRCRQRRGPAAASGPAADPDAAAPDLAAGHAIGPDPVGHITLLDPRAADLQREFFATCPRSVARALPAMDVSDLAWLDGLLATLDGMAPAEAADTIVVITDDFTDASMREAGRAARLHPGIPVFVPSWDGAGLTGDQPVFGRLQPFQRALLVDGTAPEDTWTRIARRWHERYRLRHPAVAGQASAVSRREREELDEFVRQDNVLQLRSVMAAVAAHGRRWAPSRAVPPGSIVELTAGELRAVTEAEHTRWYQRRRCAGWQPAPGGAEDDDGALANSGVVPWAELSDQDRQDRIDYVELQLRQLEDAGFLPSLPTGGPAAAASFCRVGIVRAGQLSAAWPWTGRSGNQMRGGAGDWRVVDDGGDERTVRDLEFRATHERIDGDRWRRTGLVRAWQATESVAVRTMEGRVIAQPGDWIVEGERGARWPVSDEQFWPGHRRA
jgi:hypothetical protein